MREEMECSGACAWDDASFLTTRHPIATTFTMTDKETEVERRVQGMLDMRARQWSSWRQGGGAGDRPVPATPEPMMAPVESPPPRRPQQPTYQPQATPQPPPPVQDGILREGYWGTADGPASLPPLTGRPWQEEQSFVGALHLVSQHLRAAGAMQQRQGAPQQCLACGANLGNVDYVDVVNRVAFTEGYLHYAHQHHVVPSARFYTYIASAARALSG